MATLQVQPPLLWAAGVLWPTACTAVVAARFVARRALGNRYGWDDWLIIPAWIFLCALSSLMLTGVAEKAWGYPTPSIAPDLTLVATSRQQTVTRKLYWVFLLLHTPTLTFIKLSCIAFYSRVFRTGHSRSTNIFIWVLMGLVTSWGIAFTVTTLFTCGNLTHLNYLWTSLENQLKCTVNTAMWQKGLAISDVIMDFLLLIFPIPHIVRLNVQTHRKLGLIVIFLFGSMSIVASIVRLVILLQALNVEFQVHIDEDYLSTGAAYFMLLEAGFGIMAVCLPTLAGSLRLQSIQTFFADVSQIFSIRSTTSRSASKNGGMGSGEGWNSEEHLSHLASKGNTSDSHTHVIALRPLSGDSMEESGVHVTKTVELRNHEARVQQV